MNAGGVLIFAAAGATALLGQWIKSHEKWPSWWAVLGMGIAGLAFYGLKSGWPAAWTWDGLDGWLSQAWPWSLALPGLASSLGLHSALKTDSK